MVVFQEQIAILEQGAGMFDQLETFNLKIQRISAVKFDHSETILAIACQAGESPEVKLYLLNENHFKWLKTLYGFKAQIKFLDFSSDNQFILCEDSLGEIIYYEVESQRVINTDISDFKMEFLEDGLRPDP